MFKKLWRYILALFAGSKEPRWERLDRLAETDFEKYQRELQKLSMKELNEYMDSVTDDVADRMQYGWGDLAPEVAEGVKKSQQRGKVIIESTPACVDAAISLTLNREEKAAFDDAENGIASYETGLYGEVIRIDETHVKEGYHWNPGQEHSEPVKVAVAVPRRRKRPGVFEREAFNRKERRRDAAVERRQKKSAGGV